MSYDSILADFLLHSKDPANLNNAIKLLFDKATEYDAINGISQVFMVLLRDQKYKLSVDNVRYMLQLGANPSTINNPDLGFICRSIRLHFQNDGPGILSLLLDHGLNIKDDEYWFVQKMAFLEVLISKGYDTEAIFNLINRNYPEDCEGGITDYIVDQLRKGGYIPDNNSLHLLFETALFSGRLTAVDIDLFVDLGLNPRYDNDLFLVTSCKCENTTVTNCLIGYGLDVNTRDGKPLYYAMNYKDSANMATVKLLLEHNVQVLDSHIALALQSKELAELFINHGIISCEQLAIRYLRRIMYKVNDLDIGKMLVRNGIDFNHLLQWL